MFMINIMGMRKSKNVYMNIIFDVIFVRTNRSLSQYFINHEKYIKNDLVVCC